MCDKNLLPNPSPLDAPLTNPAISTNEIVVLIIFFDFEIFAKLSNLTRLELEQLQHLDQLYKKEN